MSERIAGGERGCQGVDASGDAVSQFAKARAVSKLQFLVIAKVQFQFHERSKFEQLRTERGQFVRESATHLIHRHAMHTSRSRCDQVGHGLRLREIHPPIEKSPPGELARCGSTRSAVDKPFKEALSDEGRAVTRQLHSVLTGERMRGTEDGSHSLVEQFAVADKTAEGGRMRATLGERYARARLEKTVAKRDRLRSGDAHDGQRTTSRRRGQGADGGGISGHRLCFWGGTYRRTCRDWCKTGRRCIACCPPRI